MKVEWLQTVLAVARTGSFSEAAEVIPCAQSSVSRHIKSAEAELGVTLFQRSSNSNVVKLTEQGMALLPDIEHTVEDYCALCQRAGQYGAGRKVPLVLGLNYNTFSAASKARLLSLLYIEAPEILLTIQEFPLNSQVETLIAGKAEVFLVSHPVQAGVPTEAFFDNDLLESRFLGQVELSIAFGEDVAPAGKTAISLTELKNQNIFFHADISKLYSQGRESAPSETHKQHNLFVQACLDSGITPKIQVVDRHLADIKLTLTAQGKGVFPSMIPDFLRDYPGIKYVPVSDASFSVQYHLLSFRDNKNSASKRLTEFFVKYFHSPG